MRICPLHLNNRRAYLRQQKTPCIASVVYFVLSGPGAVCYTSAHADGQRAWVLLCKDCPGSIRDFCRLAEPVASWHGEAWRGVVCGATRRSFLDPNPLFARICVFSWRQRRGKLTSQ